MASDLGMTVGTLAIAQWAPPTACEREATEMVAKSR